MTPQQPNLHALFTEAIACDSVEKRRRYVDDACGDDGELRARLEALIEAHSGAGGFLGGQPAGVATAVQPLTEGAGTTIGPYRLLQQIGEGGMGVVFMAQQTEPVERRVALKIVKPGMDTSQVIGRFESERQTLALMDHPNIARVFDGGTTESGRPFFVMELVKGVSITQFCDERRLTPRQRLELFLPLCQAVQHAHQKGVIHRDIKPSNVLVAEYDDAPYPKIIDFGVAKAVDQRLTERTVFTEFGQVVGTIDYMSPEQAKLNQLDVDTRSDVYSLGVLLYELLTGETPLDRARLRSAAFDEMLRIIREEEPLRPSLRLSSSDALTSVAANRHVEPEQLSAAVRGELDWIVMKALEKDRSRRYATASAFGEDVARFLNDDVVEACPPSRSYRMRKAAKKHRREIIAGSVMATALVGVILAGSWAYVSQRRLDNERRMVQLDSEARSSAADGNYQAAIEQFSRLVGIQRQAYGRLSQPVLSSLGAHAAALTNAGRLSEAVRSRRQLGDAYIETLGDDHEDTILALNELVDVQLAAAAQAVRHGGDAMLSQAEAWARDAIAVTERHHLDAWRPVVNREGRRGYALLVEALYRQGKFDECHETAQRWLALPTSLKHYALELHLALLNHQLGRKDVASDWFLSAEKWHEAEYESWRVTYQDLRGEAVQKLFGSEEAVPEEVTTEQAELLYTRLLQHYPQASACLRHRRAYCRMQLGRWGDADHDFTITVEQNPEGSVFLHASHALLSLQQGRPDDYRSECRWLVEYLESRNRLGGRHAVAAIACLTSPAAELDYDHMQQLAIGSPLASGMAAYRLGQYAFAVRLLDSYRSDRRNELRDLFRAMAHYQQGNADVARTTLADVQQRFHRIAPQPGRPKTAHDLSYFSSVLWCEALIVLQEAQSLITSNDAQEQSPGQPDPF